MLADKEEESVIPAEHLFSMQPCDSHLRLPAVQCSFAPV
jgi:hypothetical protein